MSTLALNNLRNTLYIILLSIAVAGCKNTPASLATPTIPTSDFHSADLAFRLGRTIESDLIARGGDTQNRYSHIGLIIESDSGLMVIDIEPSTDRNSEIIKAQSIEEFFSPERAIAGTVMRYDLNSDQINTLYHKAIDHLNSSITFDHDYRMSDHSKMYCTELVEDIFHSVGISLSEGRSRKLPLAKESVILPSDISQNENLNTIWSYDLRPAERSAR